MQTWHDGLPSELPVFVALPRRPGMRLRRLEAASEAPGAPLDFQRPADVAAVGETARGAVAG